ncbi:hypothetical protein [Acidovorax sp. KKS102]|uniref:hypothetical protein n=1 Tax=Acidovorax sp. KKS102 TaxID=358220 RepID=UPI0011D1B7F7|nr:hypothetical protein [Acidovorax sp. KKS102]
MTYTECWDEYERLDVLVRELRNRLPANPNQIPEADFERLWKLIDERDALIPIIKDQNPRSAR